MIPSSACPPWQHADQSGACRECVEAQPSVTPRDGARSTQIHRERRIPSLDLDDNERIEIIKELWVPSIETQMEVGWTDPVEQRIQKYLPFVERSGDSALIAFFQRASAWLEAAKQKECNHGKDCLLDRNHRYYINFLRYREEFLKRALSHTKSAA